jgi:class 3 adenylate cyclase/TolB-like protein
MSQQRLAAIMFTDLMGYTALMEKNESTALELVKKNRDLHQNKIQKYKGQLVKELGDGFMATFDDTLNAISCAREIQNEAEIHEFEIPIRIGIHYGDITIDNEDIFGHGVNMASRIQSVADPGGIYISNSIIELVRERKDLETQYMGPVPLKNIKDPVPVYALKGEGLPPPNKRRIDAIIRRSLYLKYYRYAAVGAVLILAIALIWFFRTFDIERELITKSVAVIPLKNLSNNPEQDYLSTSLTDELIRELSKVNSLTVISQNSTRQYAGINYTLYDISQELNDVNYIVDGTVLLENDQIQTEIRLNDPTKEQVIWRKKYEQKVSESRQLWAEVTRDLSRMMGVYIPEEKIERLTGIRTVDPEIYALYLKGMHALAIDSLGAELALTYLNEAIERNPENAYAWAAVATAHISMGHGSHPTKEDRLKARAAAL